jgi:hypothetical protein
MHKIKNKSKKEIDVNLLKSTYVWRFYRKKEDYDDIGQYVNSGGFWDVCVCVLSDTPALTVVLTQINFFSYFNFRFFLKLSIVL